MEIGKSWINATKNNDYYLFTLCLLMFFSWSFIFACFQDRVLKAGGDATPLEIQQRANFEKTKKKFWQVEISSKRCW